MKTMRNFSNSLFFIIEMLSITFILFEKKNVSVDAFPEKSEKFMLVKTPEHKKDPDFLVVEKPGGKQSLIEIEKNRENDKMLKNRIEKQTGNRPFAVVI